MGLASATLAVEIQRIGGGHLERAVGLAERQHAVASRPALGEQDARVGGSLAQIRDRQTEALRRESDDALVAQQAAGHDRLPERPPIRGKRRQGLLPEQRREQRPQPALIGPRRVDHAGRYAPPRRRPSSFHFYRMLQNAGETSTDHIQRPSRSPRATSKRTTSKNI
jgi:hypothetical protein